MSAFDPSLPERRVPPFNSDSHHILDFRAGWVDNVDPVDALRNEFALYGFYIYDGVNHVDTLRTDDLSMLGVLEGFARDRVARANASNPTGSYFYRRA